MRQRNAADPVESAHFDTLAVAELLREHFAQLDARLARIESALAWLCQQKVVKDWYVVGEFAQLVGRSEFTCREWCRRGRVNASKRRSGHGLSAEWVISHEELVRFYREGLLPERV